MMKINVYVFIMMGITRLSKNHYKMTSPSFVYESQYTGLTAGIDEVGCGPWAGPLVAAAVILPWASSDHIPDFMHQVHDSKKLSPLKRSNIYNALRAFNASADNHQQIDWHVGIVEVQELDRLLLRNALPLAFERALNGLSRRPDQILVDGVRHPKCNYPTQMIKHGDQLSYSIAMASIIAKVTRDRLMEQLSHEFPHYGWDRNAGYGTPQHISAIQCYGLTSHHRRSYAPIKRFELEAGYI